MRFGSLRRVNASWNHRHSTNQFFFSSFYWGQQYTGAILRASMGSETVYYLTMAPIGRPPEESRACFGTFSLQGIVRLRKPTPCVLGFLRREMHPAPLLICCLPTSWQPVAHSDANGTTRGACGMVIYISISKDAFRGEPTHVTPYQYSWLAVIGARTLVFRVMVGSPHALIPLCSNDSGAAVCPSAVLEQWFYNYNPRLLSLVPTPREYDQESRRSVSRCRCCDLAICLPLEWVDFLRNAPL